MLHFTGASRRSRYLSKYTHREASCAYLLECQLIGDEYNYNGIVSFFQKSGNKSASKKCYKKLIEKQYRVRGKETIKV